MIPSSIAPPHTLSLMPRLTPGVILTDRLACQVCQKADGPCDIPFYVEFRIFESLAFSINLIFIF